MHSPLRQIRMERFKRIRLLGSGGVAEVWLAFDRKRREQVALKVLRPQYAQDEGLLRRFRREAHLIKALDSPSIVRLYGLEEDAGAPVLVMEYVAGADLKILLQLDGPMEPTHALRLLREIAAGAAVAHRAGVVHRDLKPANILMTHDGDPKITDFGIAHDVAGANLTDPNQAWGTSAYLAPEQATGQTVTPATDIYSLGVMLFEMLTGRAPYDGDDPVQVALAHIQNPIPSVHTINPMIPPGIEQLVARMMAKKPEARPADGDALVAILDRYLEGGDTPTVLHDGDTVASWRAARARPPVAELPPVKRNASREPARSPLRWLIPLLALLLLGVGFVLAEGGLAGPEPAAPSLASGAVKGLAVVPTATHTATPSPTPTLTPTPMPTRREGNGADAPAPRLDAPVILDGNISEWGPQPWLSLDYVTFGQEQWSGAADLGGRIAFAWDRDTLYMAVERRDEAHVQEQNGDALYRGDVVELWLDVDVSGDYLTSEANSDDFQIGFSAGDFAGRRAEAYVFYPTPASASRNRLVRVRSLPQPDGYTLEAAVPWELLEVTPRAELTLGYAVVLSDVDDPQSNEAQSQLTTTPRPPFMNPGAFGNLILMAEE